MRKEETKEEYQSSDFYGAYGKIYTLSDCNGNVFYVGCTLRSMDLRLRGHISEAKSYMGYVSSKKINKIKELNYDITAHIIELKWITGDSSKEALRLLREVEKEYIKKYMDLGYELCNKECEYGINEKNAQKEYVGQSFQVVGQKIIASNKPQQ